MSFSFSTSPNHISFTVIFRSLVLVPFSKPPKSCLQHTYFYRNVSFGNLLANWTRIFIGFY